MSFLITGSNLAIALATELMVMMQNSVTRTAKSWRKVTLLNNAERMVASSNVASGWCKG